jgi:hypothetical protein
MRFILGIVIGFLLTVGGTWIHDTRIDPAAPHPETLRIVNWDVASASISDGLASLRAQWDRLVNSR